MSLDIEASVTWGLGLKLLIFVGSVTLKIHEKLYLGEYLENPALRGACVLI